MTALEDLLYEHVLVPDGDDDNDGAFRCTCGKFGTSLPATHATHLARVLAPRLRKRDALIHAEAVRTFGNRMATPSSPDMDGPTLHAVWMEAQVEADEIEQRDLS